MPRITQDPNLEVRPDFISAAFDAVCTALATAEGIDQAVVAARLSDAWVTNNNTRKEAWAEQVKENEAAAVGARLAHEVDELWKEEEVEKTTRLRSGVSGMRPSVSPATSPHLTSASSMQRASRPLGPISGTQGVQKGFCG
jgi:hypothetical protein